MANEIRVRRGDTVKLKITGYLEDGTVFQSNTEENPLLVKIGEGEIVAGVEEALISMRLGTKKKITVTSDKGFGPRSKELIVEIERTKLPPEFVPHLDEEIYIPQEIGEPIQFRVKEVTDDKITFDANHPLAGKTLIYEIEVLEILNV